MASTSSRSTFASRSGSNRSKISPAASPNPAVRPGSRRADDATVDKPSEALADTPGGRRSDRIHIDVETGETSVGDGRQRAGVGDARRFYRAVTV
ncbi:MAG: hypothetical protein AB7L13_12445 [Acidimicrobiia bacterium]